jgi:hypothetical protein
MPNFLFLVSPVLAVGREDSFHANGILQTLGCKCAQIGEPEVGGAVTPEGCAKNGKDGSVARDRQQAAIRGKCSCSVTVGGEDDVTNDAV